MKGLLRRLAAVLFTDMGGFATLMQTDEDAAMRLLRRHDGLLAPHFKRHDGRVIKRLGDGFMVEFPSALSGLRAALGGQRALAEHNEGASAAEQLRVRMGLDVGDVLSENEDLFGETVNVASQICGLVVCFAGQRPDAAPTLIANLAAAHGRVGPMRATLAR